VRTVAKDEHRSTQEKGIRMSEQQEPARMSEALRRRIIRAVAGTVAYLAFVVFGILLILDGDWVPGSLILGAGLVGWAVLVPIIGGLCREGPAPSNPSSKTIG
jgi:hypothetical protein